MYFCLGATVTSNNFSPLLSDYHLTLPQLQLALHHLASQSFCAGIVKNHIQHSSTCINLCDHYSLPFINSSISTITCYITYLTQHFQSACNVRNYISGVRFLNKELGLAPDSLESFPVIALLQAADITMCVQKPPNCGHFPRPPHPSSTLQTC